MEDPGGDRRGWEAPALNAGSILAPRACPKPTHQQLVQQSRIRIG